MSTPDTGITYSTPLRAVELAAQFIADTAGERGLWPAIFQRWAERRGLSEAEAREVRGVVQRERVMRAVERHGETQ